MCGSDVAKHTEWGYSCPTVSVKNTEEYGEMYMYVIYFLTQVYKIMGFLCILYGKDITLLALKIIFKCTEYRRIWRMMLYIFLHKWTSLKENI